MAGVEVIEQRDFDPADIFLRTVTETVGTQVGVDRDGADDARVNSGVRQADERR
jgi:hypothetical protein